MSEPENLVLEYLRRLDRKFDRIGDDVQELKHRVGSLARQGAHMLAEIANLRIDMAHMSERIDRIDGRIARVERRLEIVDAEA